MQDLAQFARSAKRGLPWRRQRARREDKTQAPASRPPAHEIKVVTTDPDNQGVDIETIERGSAEHYTVSYDIWNDQYSPAFARITLTGHPGQ